MSYIPAELRRLVIERAKGYCEYCLIHQDDYWVTHEADHIIPEKHRGATSEENLCLTHLTH
jgi:5-methylcytosine-specific restriction endonuclease McrA